MKYIIVTGPRYEQDENGVFRQVSNPSRNMTKTIYVFLITVRNNVPPFEILDTPKTIAFTDDDTAKLGEYLGDISKDKSGHFSYCQRTASFRTRLTPENLRAIAKHITRLENAEEKQLAKGNPQNRQTQDDRKKAAEAKRGNRPGI